MWSPANLAHGPLLSARRTRLALSSLCYWAGWRGAKSMANRWHCSQDSDRSPVCSPPLLPFHRTPPFSCLPQPVLHPSVTIPQPLLSDWHLKGGRGRGRRRCSTLWNPPCRGTAGDICREAHKRQLKACNRAPSFSSSLVSLTLSFSVSPSVSLTLLTLLVLSLSFSLLLSPPLSLPQMSLLSPKS